MEIITEHLRLREFEENDLAAMLAYQLDPRYARYYEPMSDEQKRTLAEKLLRTFLDNQQEVPRTKYQVAITLRQDGRLIGNVGVRKRSQGDAEAEMGCELSPEHWNQGYATEATSAMLAFGFEQLGLHRISATTMIDNMGAWRVLEKLGMQREGELRETTRLSTGWANSVIYGILEHEWRVRQAGG